MKANNLATLIAIQVQLDMEQIVMLEKSEENSEVIEMGTNQNRHYLHAVHLPLTLATFASARL